ncbi:MAG TPA: C25 family cysteine peptidase, partial [Candidatus Thermoplasmatota archaeon]
MSRRAIGEPRWTRVSALLAAALLALPAAAALPAGGDAADPGPQPLALINATQFEGTQYLIVTAAPFAAAMQSIADWKTQKGLPAKVALIGDITQSYPGRDDAERLHNFLQDVHFNATDGTLKYVLLGGGANVIPIRYLHTEGSVITWYTHDDVFSDVYYAGLDSDWDANQNGTFGEYGEEDWDANVLVGRMPFADATQAATMRDNLLSYERAPLVGAWMRNAVAFASVMDPPNNVNNPGSPYEYSWGEDNAVRSVWNTEGHLPAQMNLDILADYYEIVGGNYTRGQD